jgi:protein tyrosine phosphatase (PTP) superfamily phosphohydrolase (DUF442 family)
MNLRIAFLTAALITASCSTGLAQVTNASATNPIPSTIHALKAKGIENFYQLSDRIYSGSAPEGDAAFAELKTRGIRTIITVDGAKPEVETARRYGIRYVHLPIGYDGVPTNQAVRLVKAAETLPGPIFVHCHHGLHRGPAGAAVICMGLEGWTPDEAEAWLKLAGTATNYAGLYRSVRQFHPPAVEVLSNVSPDFPEKSKVSPLADVMIEIDERFDHLKLLKKAGYRPPAANPDLDPAHESMLLDELFKELLRGTAGPQQDNDFKARLNEAELAAGAFHSCLGNSPIVSTRADAAYQRVSDACNACHKAHRN